MRPKVMPRGEGGRIIGKYISDREILFAQVLTHRPVVTVVDDAHRSLGKSMQAQEDIASNTVVAFMRTAYPFTWKIDGDYVLTLNGREVSTRPSEDCPNQLGGYVQDGHGFKNRIINCRYDEITVTTQQNRKVKAVVVRTISKIAKGNHLYVSYGTAYWQQWTETHGRSGLWDGDSEQAKARDARAEGRGRN
jgi:hypothetical protein